MWNCSRGLFLAFDIDRVLLTDPAYPFCNKIGQLRSDPHNHWGYRFAQGGRDVSVWIQKMPATQSGEIAGSLQDDLEAPAVAWAVQRTTVD